MNQFLNLLGQGFGLNKLNLIEARLLCKLVNQTSGIAHVLPHRSDEVNILHLGLLWRVLIIIELEPRELLLPPLDF
jgi:hypothetical protein